MTPPSTIGRDRRMRGGSPASGAYPDGGRSASRTAFALIGAAALVLATASGPGEAAAASAGDQPPIASLTGPFIAAGGEQILLCAANGLGTPHSLSPAVGAANTTSALPSLTVTLQILNAITGAVVAERQVSLPPLGSTEEAPPDPCLQFTVAPATFAPATNLFLARIELNPQPLPPGRCAPRSLSAALQVFTPDSNGNPANVRMLSFEPPDPCLVFNPSSD